MAVPGVIQRTLADRPLKKPLKPSSAAMTLAACHVFRYTTLPVFAVDWLTTRWSPCVCILVLMTSRGVVNAPAIAPAADAQSATAGVGNSSGDV